MKFLQDMSSYRAFFRVAGVCGVFLLLLSAISGCKVSVNSVATELNPSGWDPDSSVEITYDNTDTVSLRNIRVFIFHPGGKINVPDSLPLMIITVPPDSLAVSERWVLPLSEKGMGQGAVMAESSAMYRSDVVLSQAGRYVFSFSHQEQSPVENLWAIGVDIFKKN